MSPSRARAAGANLKRDDLRGGVSDLTSAIGLSPNDAEAWFERGAARGGITIVREGEVDGRRRVEVTLSEASPAERQLGITNLRKAVELDPKHRFAGSFLEVLEKSTSQA